MQQSPYEIKEKLLQALDSNYNVVDMGAVLDVISALEKTIITKEALEKTRIGKYINELRKKTSNEHLARRAKELVKSWRRLLPQRINGEESHSIISSPGGVTVVGPGPGPGIGPGPGPGNRSFKACLLVPANTRYKTSSPSMMVERSSSPYFSSASNSPLLNSSLLQGSNIPAMPSNYAPLKLATSQTSFSTDANSVNKILLNSSNQSKNLTSSQIFRPVSPSAHKSDLVTSSGTCVLPSRTCDSISPGLRNNSSSSSPSLTSANVCSQNVSPTSTFSATHSSLDIAKTNAANKRLRKESNCAATKDLINNDSNSRLGNGDVVENILHSESSAFNSVSVCNSNSVDGDKTLIVSSSKTPKRKRSFDNKNELQENRLGDMLASIHSGSKLPKVKTTQQLIAELQAKKSTTTTSLSKDTLPSVDTLHSSKAEVSRTKSELLKKFLISSQTARSESDQESPVDESSDFGSHPVPDSVIQTNFVISSSISYPDPVDEEIKTILSDLPPLNHEVDLDSAASPCARPITVSDEDLSRLNEPWEYVNGVYDCHGTWRPWQECTEQKSYLEERFQILPYVNID